MIGPSPAPRNTAGKASRLAKENIRTGSRLLITAAPTSRQREGGGAKFLGGRGRAGVGSPGPGPGRERGGRATAHPPGQRGRAAADPAGEGRLPGSRSVPARDRGD